MYGIVFLTIAVIAATYDKKMNYYHPFSCDPETYYLAFIKGNNTNYLHGLWPEKCRGVNNTNYPTFCLDKTYDFNTTKVWDIIPEMCASYTPDKGECNEYLIRHEWKKHGSCTMMNEREYFSTSLLLYYRYKIFNVSRILLDSEYNPIRVENY